MATIKVKLLILFCLSVAAQEKPKFNCNNAFQFTRPDPIDWSIQEGKRPKKVTMAQVDTDNAKSYAYCATSLIEAEHVDYSVTKKVISFSANDILTKSPESKDITGALEFLKKNSIKPLSASSTSSLASPKVQTYCSQRYTLDDVKRILMHKPACVKLTVPADFLNKEKGINGVYDCATIPKKPKNQINYDALLYGRKGDTYFVQTTRTAWGDRGSVKLQNAEKCGLNNQVSFIGVLAESSPPYKVPNEIIRG